MAQKISLNPLVWFAVFSICMIANLHAAENRPPAGQMCAEGAYVTGFDSAGNIICSVPAGSHSPSPAKNEQQVNMHGDGECPSGCQEGVGDTGAVVVAMDEPVKEKPTAEEVARPVISDIKPRWIVFGARETGIAIAGAGFTDASVVKFQGSDYSPTVNAAGTELRVTIATRNLPIGRYAITVSNGPGLETTRRRALEVY